jgi:hypothetical protein
VATVASPDDRHLNDGTDPDRLRPELLGELDNHELLLGVELAEKGWLPGGYRHRRLGPLTEKMEMYFIGRGQRVRRSVTRGFAFRVLTERRGQ